MNEHALDAMIYAWMVMKEKEESSMEGIFMGQINGSCSRISEEDGKRCAQVCFHDTESNACSKLSHYNKTYSLVLSDDVIKTNDELLRLRDQVAKLETELAEIKTTRTLREAYISGVEKGCEGLREERDRWKNRCNSVMTDISNALSANGIEFKLKDIHSDGNWDVVIDIPALNEAKKKVDDLEKKLAAAKSNETFWRDRKEEEEDYHHYWLHTFDRAVKQAADKGIHIDVRGTDEERNAGVVIVDNGKANELESQVVQMEDANQKLRKRISAADEEIEKLKARDISKVDRGDHWKRNYETLTEYWDNTYKDIVAAGKEVGVKIKIIGRKPDGNVGTVSMINEKALDLAYKLNNAKQKHDKKWQAMLDALKAKGVEVIYMGEQDEKPCVDVKIPEIDILKKELEALKSRTLDNVEIRLSCGDIVWTYCDGFVHVSSGIDGIISADQITTGTIPKCKSCVHYMHNPSRYAHDWCYRPVPKEGGAGYIRKLNKEEVEGPACGDFKARKEWMQK